MSDVAKKLQNRIKTLENVVNLNYLTTKNKQDGLNYDLKELYRSQKAKATIHISINLDKS